MFFSNKLKNIKKINHCFFSKRNGFSQGIYKSLNCGKGSRDKKKNIYKNLNYVAKRMKVKKSRLILMHQTHSNKVVKINKSNYKKKIIADAMITKMNGVALSVVTADCVPIILYDIKNEIVACVHAGWKGAFSGIIKNTITEFRKMNSNNQIYACVGPCIAKRNYEVDLPFYQKFIKRSGQNKKYFFKKKGKKKLFDLRKFVTDNLLKFKVKVDQINRDTYSEKSNFFSFRRSCKLKHKDYGRCISSICKL